MAINVGITGPESVEYIGGNAKMNEFQAAMGLCNLRYLNQEIEKRKKVYERYIENLNEIKGLKLPFIQKGLVSNYAYFPVLIDNFGFSTDSIHDEFKKKNIYTRKILLSLNK